MPTDSLVQLQFDRLPSSISTPTIGATLAFVSNEKIALSICHEAGGCDLHLIRLASEGPETEASATTPPQTVIRGGVFPTVGGGVLVWSKDGDYLYDSNLRHDQALTFRILNYPADRSETVAGTGPDGTKIYRLAPKIEGVRQIQGKVLSVSGDRLLLRQDEILKIESLDGKPLGSFKIEPVSKCGTLAEFVGQTDHIYVHNCHGISIVDFNGIKQLSLTPPPGWGHRHGWSADGRRLSFDQYTRTVPAFQSFLEAVGALLSFGMGAADQQPNGEFVQVVDVKSGKSCFSWDGQRAPLGRAGEYHADISPSGSLLAMVTRTSLLVYRLPKVCNAEK